MWRLTGQSAEVPVHKAFSSQVAKLAERHLAPAAMKLQPKKNLTFTLTIFIFLVLSHLIKLQFRQATNINFCCLKGAELDG